MASVILKRKSVGRPAFGAQVDWSHPLSNGLVECVLFHEGAGTPTSLIRGEASTATSSPTWVTSQYGRSRNYSGAGARDSLIHTPARSITGPITVSVGVVNAEATATDNWHELASKRASTGNSAVEYALNFNTNNNVGRGIQFFWNTGSAYQVAAIGNNSGNIAGPFQNVFMVVTGTRDSGNVGRIYRDGRLGVTSGALSAAAAGTTPLVFGACNDGSEPLNGALYFCYIWARQLSDAEVLWHAQESYAIIRPPVSRRRDVLRPTVGAIVRVGNATTEHTSGGATIVTNYTATSGNALVVIVSYWSSTSGGTQTCSISDGVNTWTQDIYGSGSPITHSGNFIFHAVNITGGALTITATTNDGIAYLMQEVIEYSGIATSSPVDGTPNYGHASGTAATSGSFTPSVSPELLISAITTDSTSNGSTITPGSGWTAVYNEPNGSTYMNWMVAEQILSSLSGSYTANATVVSTNWVASIVGFKGAGSSGPAVTVTPQIFVVT